MYEFCNIILKLFNNNIYYTRQLEQDWLEN